MIFGSNGLSLHRRERGGRPSEECLVPLVLCNRSKSGCHPTMDVRAHTDGKYEVVRVGKWNHHFLSGETMTVSIEVDTNDCLVGKKET